MVAGLVAGATLELGVNTTGTVAPTLVDDMVMTGVVGVMGVTGVTGALAAVATTARGDVTAAMRCAIELVCASTSCSGRTPPPVAGAERLVERRLAISWKSSDTLSVCPAEAAASAGATLGTSTTGAATTTGGTTTGSITITAGAASVAAVSS